MDRGRIMDQVQNQNARFIDNFGAAGKTSVNVSNPPGGKSSFSLGWSEPEVPQKKSNKINNDSSSEYNYSGKSQIGGQNYNNKNSEYQKNLNSYNAYDNNNEDENKSKTSVKVKYAPGGKSNFSFGSDHTSMDDYRKK